MKKIVFYTLLLALIGTVGCNSNRNENSDGNDSDDDYNYRNGRSTADSTVRDSVDSVLLPTSPPVTPIP